MKIERVDFYYLALPELRDVGDGSQDALLVRVEAGGIAGWGECEASPLACLAAWIAPMSHSACKPVRDSVLGERIEGAEDIRRINRRAREQSFDLLQADHTLSGVDIALWDWLGRKRGEPVWRLLGMKRARAKTAYASQLFGDDAEETLRRARRVARAGYRAAKFGWGPYGRGSVKADAEQVRAAREGLGKDAALLVDAGTVWGEDVGKGAARLAALEKAGAVWLEEPFVNGALGAYRELARKSRRVKLAGGEGCHNFQQAQAMMDYAGIGYVQIDTGRIGGITTAKEVADYAKGKGVRFVNHTFTTHLALSASIQPYADGAEDDLCEYPFEPSALAQNFTKKKMLPDANGRVALPEGPGLGIEPDCRALAKYAVEVEIKVAGKRLVKTGRPRRQL